MTKVCFKSDPNNNDTVSINIDLFSGASPIVLINELVKIVSQYPDPKLNIIMGDSLFENIFTFIAVQYVLSAIPESKIENVTDNMDELVALSDLHKIIFKVEDQSIIDNFSNYLKNMGNRMHYSSDDITEE